MSAQRGEEVFSLISNDESVNEMIFVLVVNGFVMLCSRKTLLLSNSDHTLLQNRVRWNILSKDSASGHFQSQVFTVHILHHNSVIRITSSLYDVHS
jgi:hypothetical protein